MRRGAEPAVADFIHAEADLLDRAEYDAWLSLYAEDAFYWIPLDRAQTSPLDGPSHVYDTKDALMARVIRLQDPQNVTQQPPSRCSRVVGRVWEAAAAQSGTVPEDAVVVQAPVHTVEALPNHDPDVSLRIFAGTTTWCLSPEGNGYRIRWKRIDLVNSEMGMYGVSIIL